MASLTFNHRCLMFVVVVVAVGVIFGGVMSLVNSGYNLTGMVVLGSGVLILLMTIPLGILITWTTESPSTNSSEELSPNQDPPPKYRHTWRKEYIETSPEDIRGELQKTLDQAPSRGSKRGSIPLIWTVDTEFKTHIHDTPSEAPSLTNNRHTSVSLVSIASTRSLSESQNRGRSASQWTSVSIGSRGRSISCSVILEDDYDKGLPSYEEVQSG
ncbi:uncharacterized protein [Palaemon carinicauda]|uniref:uncharacterized protein isoform X2 n=1 Tax=Palaemon carinicauda TaxID=392227 RepID=UPI0035B671F0